MPGPLEATGALKDPSRFGALGMGARQFTGLWTQRSPFRDAAVPYLVSKFYSGSRFDSILDGINREITPKLTDKRAPGSIVYNSQSFPTLRSLYSWRYVQNGVQQIRVMADADANVYDATGPSTKFNVWSKNAGSGRTRFLGVNTELFFNDGIEPKKWLQSALTWNPNTLYDGAATSDTPLGDFIIDDNNNVQQAVGGFTLLISAVQILANVLTLTLDTLQLVDPTGTVTGVATMTGGDLPADNWFARVAGVDANGNTTEAGTESAAVVTTGADSQIVWTWAAISGAVSYRIYIGNTSGGETFYFTSNTNSFTQTVASSTLSGAPPLVNTTSVTVPNNLFQMVGVQLALSGITAANFLNGQTITIAGVLPGGQSSNQITAAFAHADYPSTTDTGQASTGTGITAGVEPTWAQALAAVTQDGGAQWINRGSAVQNWGIATPGSAPSVFPTAVPPSATYPKWQADTFYWPSRCAWNTVGGVQQIFLLTQSGKTGSAPPTWNTTVIGAITADNTAAWTYEGPAAWIANNNYPKGAYTTFQPPTGGLQVFIALNPGTSGANQNAWTGGVGTTIQDNDILWMCLGTIVPYLAASTPTNFALQQWPTIGDLAFRTSFTVTPTPNTVIYCVPLGSNIRPGGAVTITGCPNAALNGTGTVIDTSLTSIFTTGLMQILVSIPYGGGAYHPFTDQVGGNMQYTAPGTGLTPLINLSASNIVLDSNGFLEQIQDPGGFSGLTQPTWAATGGSTQEVLTADITSFSITADVATLVADNDFSNLPGAEVTIAGMGVGTYLNATFPLLAANDATFQVQIAHADIGPTSDTGTATIPGGALWLNIGPFAPKSTATSQYAYSFGDSVTGHVATASKASVPIMLQAGFQATLQGFGSADPQVDTIWLWATPQGQSTLIFMDKIANPGGGVPWTYQRTMPDVSTTGGPELNPFIAAPVADSNDPPPANITAPVYHVNRIWGIVNNTVVYSDGPDALVGSGNEAFDPDNVIPYPAQPIKLFPVTVQNGGLLVYTTDGIYIILGTGTADNPFYTTRYYSKVSISGYDAAEMYNNSVFQMESNGMVSSVAVEYPFNPQSGYNEVGFPIGDQFLQVTTGGATNLLFNSTFAEGLDGWITTPRAGDTFIASSDEAIYTVVGSPLIGALTMAAQQGNTALWEIGNFLIVSGSFEDTAVSPLNPNTGALQLVVSFRDSGGTVLGTGQASYPLNGSNPAFRRIATAPIQIPANTASVHVSYGPTGGTLPIGSTIVAKQLMVQLTTANGTLAAWTPTGQPVYDPATAYLAYNKANTTDTGLYVADGGVGWFRMSLVSPPESGILWSPRRAIVGGTSCVQDVEVATGTHALLIGPALNGPILMRDSSQGTFTDNGQTYPAWDDKGVNKVCSTGQWVEFAHISAKSTPAINTASRPEVSVLFGEISASIERPWTVLNLDSRSQDPASTPESKSYFSDRYVLAQNGSEAVSDCVLTRFDFRSQDIGDELHDWEIFATVQDEKTEQTGVPKR